MSRKRRSSKSTQPSTQQGTQAELPLLDLRAADLPATPPADTSRPADASVRPTRPRAQLWRPPPPAGRHRQSILRAEGTDPTARHDQESPPLNPAAPAKLQH